MGLFLAPAYRSHFRIGSIGHRQDQYNALVPCLMAAVFADIACSAWGIKHTHYHINTFVAAPDSFTFLHVDFLLLAKIILAGITFGLSGYLFARLTHAIKVQGNHFITKHKWLIPVIGGCLIILLTLLLDTRDYLGLGVMPNHPGGASITTAFQAQG
ncbi:chloride channel protein [Paraflavitalea speifideaquila]|uniref:chloride channel protein n=1 Tax=Paraflavitalea speifideaquila TaxID=3076558 RepID=UPI0028EB965C|nr:chloride channel protein [Paraflavitalea speifideiaquila]